MTKTSLSPVYSLLCGHIFMVIVILTLYGLGVYKNNNYFSWGPPIEFFTSEIESSTAFYVILVMIFVHQLITNWIYEVVYPWIINTIQNIKEQEIPYRKSTCLLIINMNSLYSQIHLAFIISGITSQISFLMVLVVADLITLSYINWQYLKTKIVVPNSRSTEIELPSIEQNEV